MNKKEREMIGGFYTHEIFGRDDNEKLEKFLKNNPIDHVIDPAIDTSFLIFAVKARATRCFYLLLESGVNINYLDRYKRSALFYAIYGINAEFSLALIEAGADLKIEFEYRFTPLVMCLTQKEMRSALGFDPVIRALLLRGSKLEGVPAYVSIAPWMKELETKVEKHRQLALSVYASQRKTEQKACFPPKEIVALISKMIWEKRV